MIVEDAPAWAPHMRSTTPLRKSATRYLVDPSLGVAALGAGPPQLLAALDDGRWAGLEVKMSPHHLNPLSGREVWCEGIAVGDGHRSPAKSGAEVVAFRRSSATLRSMRPAYKGLGVLVYF